MRLPRLAFSLKPRTLVIAMVAIVAVVALAVLLSVLLAPAPEGRIELAALSEEGTATVGLAGIFPAEGDAPLANPLGIAIDGDRVYVAESDAGKVRIFDDRGGRVGEIVLPVASGAQAVYPSSIAVAEDRLAVVDNAAARVIVVEADEGSPAEVLFTLGDAKTKPVQPTSVAFREGEYFVADGEKSIKVYDEDGGFVRTIAADLEPRLTFVNGMLVGDGVLYAADSNAGRVVVLDPATGKQQGVFPERYGLPRDIVRLSGGALAVVDTFERAVIITDADGTRLDVIDVATVPAGAMNSPRSAAWLEDTSRLYVTDSGTGHVVIFNIRLQ